MDDSKEEVNRLISVETKEQNIMVSTSFMTRFTFLNHLTLAVLTTTVMIFLCYIFQTAAPVPVTRTGKPFLCVVVTGPEASGTRLVTGLTALSLHLNQHLELSQSFL